MNIDNVSPGASGLDQLLRKKDAARVIGLSATSLWRLEKANLLTPVQIMPGVAGYRASELQTFIETRPRATPNTARMAAALASPRHGRAGRVPVASSAEAVPVKVDQVKKAEQAKERRS